METMTGCVNHSSRKRLNGWLKDPNSLYIFLITDSQQFSWHESAQCCRSMLPARVGALQSLGELLWMHTNLQAWPCSVVSSSCGARQGQHVLSHPALSLVMLYIRNGHTRHLKVTEAEDELCLFTKCCQSDCHIALNFDHSLDSTVFTEGLSVSTFSALTLLMKTEPTFAFCLPRVEL